MRKILCLCCWSDLLGFGSWFEQNQWRLPDSGSNVNLKRIQSLLSDYAKAVDPFRETALVLNDGFARVYDFTGQNRDPMAIARWIWRVIMVHQQFNHLEKRQNLPGMRSVLSIGERLDLGPGNMRAGELMFTDPSIDRPYKRRICVYSPFEFQLNLAFSKAYLIDSLGSRGGVKGSNLYVDEAILDLLRLHIHEKEFSVLLPGKTSKNGMTGTLELLEKNQMFFINEKYKKNEYIYTVVRETDRRNMNVFSFAFDSRPVNINHRSICTTIWKLKRFKPPDWWRWYPIE